MKNQNVMEDPDDLELKKLMGPRFQDQTQEATPAPKGEKKQEPVQEAPIKKKSGRKVMDAVWAPVKTEATELQRLADCAKQTVLYGGISAVLFWWQQAGLLDPKAAVPSFIVLALLAGVKIGSCMARG